MDREALRPFLSTTLRDLPLADHAATPVIRGKVRDILDLGDELLIATTDRISAFDRVLSTIPCKGQVLNELSLFWFNQTAAIVPNHIIEKISPRTVRVKKCSILPIEVVVRGYLTGSAWRDYEKGKPISGIKLPAGMKASQRFTRPLFTPSTKAKRGTHDEPISVADILASGLVEKKLMHQVEETARALFARGTEIAALHGLILVDTKYEFGLADGNLTVVDEMHTPDSSRYWYADTYPERFAAGEKQRELDKEYLRQWLIERDYMGDGVPPEIPDDIRLETGLRYITAYEIITGASFSPGAIDATEEKKLIEAALGK